jgi:DNA-binding NtrC family response regulator
MHGSVLIVDDEVGFAKSFAKLLRLQSYQTETAFTAAEARTQMAKMHPDVVLMDMMLPDADGSELMESLVPDYPDTAFIIVTAHGTIRAAVHATQRGAVDFLTKPVEPDVLFLTVRNALRGRAMNEEVRRLRSGALGNDSYRKRGPTKFPSAAMQATMTQAQLAAAQNGIVLLLGESGTGKDHVARWIHKNSGRADGPFFAINCAALPRELAESELFGHEPGAFTGSRGRKRGLLELAEKGTLLLDEIGELDAALQSKLLTFLDTRHIMRIGGERQIRVEARLIAATNRDLEAEVERGTFRRDLYYRLNVFPILLPPLRERIDDLPMLIDEIFDRLTDELGLAQRPTLDPEVLDTLSPYPWPGNVRELRNVLERALMLSSGGVIRREHVNISAQPHEWQVVVSFPQGESLHDVTTSVARKLVIEALRRGKSKQEAARLLGISRHALAHQLQSLGLKA